MLLRSVHAYLCGQNNPQNMSTTDEMWMTQGRTQFSVCWYSFCLICLGIQVVGQCDLMSSVTEKEPTKEKEGTGKASSVNGLQWSPLKVG